MVQKEVFTIVLSIMHDLLLQNLRNLVKTVTFLNQQLLPEVHVFHIN